MENKKTVVTGGSGMVGKSLKEIMPGAVYLSSEDYNLTLERDVALMYHDHRPDTVIHLAAKVGGIIDNINKPGDYFTDNVLMNTNLIDYAQKRGVERFIGILSTCIYPDTVKKYPMKESDLHLGPPAPTNFSYGYSKRCMAVQIDAYNKQHTTNYNYLIPSNLYGEHDKYGENSHFVAALIKKIMKAKEEKSKHITLFGTGTPLRQFLYAGDLAKIIKICIDNDYYDSFNVAPSENYSIKEIAEVALKACDAEHLKIEFDATKPDGQFRKDVSNKFMSKILKDFEFTPLYEGIKKTYEYLIENSMVL